MRAAVLLLLAGCQSLFGMDDPGKLVDADAIPTADARECWGTDIAVCVIPPPTMPRTLAGLLDTSNATNCDRVDNGLCVIAATTLTVEATSVRGSRPLVLIASGTLTVNGLLDAASHRDPMKRGPGVDATPACPAFAGSPTYQNNGGFAGGGAGGGAGGTFANKGGNGGGSLATNQGGTAATAAIAPVFRAGCAGQNGGVETGNTMIALGGAGGGAVYLIAGGKLDITTDGSITASGAGGEPGRCVNCAQAELRDSKAFGGGGGGSGGAIVLEAPSIVIAPITAPAARVHADGGGGGQGSSRSLMGEAGGETNGMTAAVGGRGTDTGGTGPSNGGDGGASSHGSVKIGSNGLQGDTVTAMGGGGGGGGGGGYVKTIGVVSGGGTISPT